MKKALSLLEYSAANDCREGMRELGYIYEKGGLYENDRLIKLVEIDLNKAQRLYQRAAELGDNLAQNYLGSFYFNHTKEYEKAVNLFR